MGRNGIAFMALLLFVAFLANSLLLIIGALLSVVGILAATTFIGGVLKSWGASANLPAGITNPQVMDQYVIPPGFSRLEEIVLFRLQVRGDSSHSTMYRYLEQIQVLDGHPKIPSFLENGVVMKMLWEYRKKYGCLNFPSIPEPITSDDILRPIPAFEKDAFYEFCIAQANC